MLDYFIIISSIIIIIITSTIINSFVGSEHILEFFVIYLLNTVVFVACTCISLVYKVVCSVHFSLVYKFCIQSIPA